MTSHPKDHYCSSRTEEDPFPDRSLLNTINKDQHDDIGKAVDDTQKTAKTTA